MPSDPLLPHEFRKRRRERVWILVLFGLFVFLAFFEFKLTRASNTLPFVNSIFFFGILNLNLVILIAIVWLVFRNVGKLLLERRRRILGSKLKAKLVVAFLGFALVPTLVLFVISSLYINSSFDKWFSIKVQNTLEGSLEITRIFYRNTEHNSMHFAEHLAKQVLQSPNTQEILNQQRELLALNAVEFYSDPMDERLIATAEPGENLPRDYPRLALDVLERAFSGEKVSIVHHIRSGDLIRVIIPVRAEARQSPLGVLVVDTYVPVSLVNKVDEISSVFEDYKDINPLQYPIKTAYFVLLILMTLVIIFVAIWMGLYLARELTVPVERLVQGAQDVGGGNLDIQIERSQSQDEIATLVDSFNRMTSDLRENRERLKQTALDAETRKLQLEAVLANVGTGVIVVDSDHRISTFNRAASQILNQDSAIVTGKPYSNIFTGDSHALSELIARLEEISIEGRIQAETIQWNDHSSQETRSLAAIGTPLVEGRRRWGVVVVIEDMTYLIKGQREMAWREVARRIAHEIKNPLTPIKLSAQRLQKRLSGHGGEEGLLIKECTDLIIKNTDELKELVNEFSNFARFPEANPSPNRLNETIQEVVQLYSQAHPWAPIRFAPELKIPVFDFDRDQIKRGLINLFDNAIAALEGVTQPKLEILTHYDAELGIATITVEDNGPGMTEEVRGRVFEPYFSTKRGGTGLGLAITKRIVNDHNGFIRVQSAPGKGTIFNIELPTAAKSFAAKQTPHLG